MPLTTPRVDNIGMRACVDPNLDSYYDTVNDHYFVTSDKDISLMKILEVMMPVGLVWQGLYLPCIGIILSINIEKAT